MEFQFFLEVLVGGLLAGVMYSLGPLLVFSQANRRCGVGKPHAENGFVIPSVRVKCTAVGCMVGVHREHRVAGSIQPLDAEKLSGSRLRR